MYRVNTIDDEKRLLEEMLHLQSQIRQQREQQRKRKVQNTDKYTKMFEPVTKSLNKLVVNLPDEPEDVKPELINFDVKEEPVIPEIELREPGELYKTALSKVPRKLRDDGMLGLNTDNHTIGNYIYEVEGNILHVKGEDEKEFEINELDLWKLLLVMNPTKIRLKLEDGGTFLPFVQDYIHIVNELNLLESYKGSTTRAKYKILHKGSGFLYSVQPPTIVLPSDKNGLISELLTALSELRAGNTMMQNIVVPLAQEAERRNILPKNLLSPDEKTWIFA